MYKLEILPLDEKNEAKKEKPIVKDPKWYIVLVHGICHGADIISSLSLRNMDINATDGWMPGLSLKRNTA